MNNFDVKCYKNICSSGIYAVKYFKESVYIKTKSLCNGKTFNTSGKFLVENLTYLSSPVYNNAWFNKLITYDTDLNI